MSDDDRKFPSQLAERFQVRMPDGLRDALRKAAADAGRSMNTEIVSRLEEFDRLTRKAYAAELSARFTKEENARLLDDIEKYRSEIIDAQAKIAVLTNRIHELESANLRDVRPDAFQRKLAVARAVADKALAGADEKAREEVAHALAKWISSASVTLEVPKSE